MQSLLNHRRSGCRLLVVELGTYDAPERRMASLQWPTALLNPELQNVGAQERAPITRSDPRGLPLHLSLKRVKLGHRVFDRKPVLQEFHQGLFLFLRKLGNALGQIGLMHKIPSLLILAAFQWCRRLPYSLDVGIPAPVPEGPVVPGNRIHVCLPRTVHGPVAASGQSGLIDSQTGQGWQLVLPQELNDDLEPAPHRNRNRALHNLVVLVRPFGSLQQLLVPDRLAGLIPRVFKQDVVEDPRQVRVCGCRSHCSILAFRWPASCGSTGALVLDPMCESA